MMIPLKLLHADRSGKYIREELVDGRYLNSMRLRQDVREIPK